jgi:predicted restriction endonuclease
LNHASLQQASGFFLSLLDAYGDRCCVTAEPASAVLEAAHIHPYLGADTNDPANGLLLRSDWHTLFDLGAWTLDKTFSIMVSRQLGNSSYAAFEGAKIKLPNILRFRPSQAAIRFHRERIFQA